MKAPFKRKREFKQQRDSDCAPVFVEEQKIRELEGSNCAHMSTLK